MDFKEFTAKTVSDAITEACTHFVIPSDKLEYEIVENGSAGFLGIGAKPAVIKARILEEKPAADSSKKKNTKKEEPKKDFSKKENAKKEEPKKDIQKKEVKKEAETVKEAPLSKPEKKKVPVNVDEAAIKGDAEKFLTDVFKAMNIEVALKSEYFTSEGELDVELSGPEMGVLIGKRGQTLDSLQYLTSLVVNKDAGSYIRVKVDTEDYRKRRKDTLENLAKNLSYKVKRTRRPVSLEPMNPYERRIIHSALQGDRYVTTHSEGEEPYRRVVITPKRSER